MKPPKTPTLTTPFPDLSAPAPLPKPVKAKSPSRQQVQAANRYQVAPDARTDLPARVDGYSRLRASLAKRGIEVALRDGDTARARDLATRALANEVARAKHWRPYVQANAAFQAEKNRALKAARAGKLDPFFLFTVYDIAALDEPEVRDILARWTREKWTAPHAKAREAARNNLARVGMALAWTGSGAFKTLTSAQRRSKHTEEKQEDRALTYFEQAKERFLNESRDVERTRWLAIAENIIAEEFRKGGPAKKRARAWFADWLSRL